MTVDERLAELAAQYTQAKRDGTLSRVAALGPRIDRLLDLRLATSGGHDLDLGKRA